MPHADRYLGYLSIWWGRNGGTMKRSLTDFIDTLDTTFTKTLRASALEAGHDELTATQLRLIATIHHLGTPTPTEVADALGITRPSVSEHIRRLEVRGMLRRAPSERDGRSFLLHLQPPATSLVAARDDAVRSVVDLIQEALGSEGAETFASLMQQFLDHVRGDSRADIAQSGRRDRIAVERERS